MGKFVVILLITFWLFNVMFKKIIFYNISYSRKVDKGIVEPGEDFEIEIIVENKKPLPVSYFQVLEKIPKGLIYRIPGNVFETHEYNYHTTTMSLSPKEKIIRKFKTNLLERGKYKLDEVEFVGGDLLALDSVSKYMDFQKTIAVMPKALSPRDRLVPYGSYYGDVSIKRWIIEDPILTIGVREYTGYEPQKNIHWPTSAKANKLMVKNFDYTTDSSVLILLNVECSKPCWVEIRPKIIEECISLTRGILEEFEEQGIPYGFLTNGENEEKELIGKGLGEVHFFGIMQSLAKINYCTRCEFEKILSETSELKNMFTNIIIITPKIQESYVEQINMLGKQSNKLMVVSIKRDNLDMLDRSILTLVEGSEKNEN